MCWPWNLGLFCRTINRKQFSWLPVQKKFKLPLPDTKLLSPRLSECIQKLVQHHRWKIQKHVEAKFSWWLKPIEFSVTPSDNSFLYCKNACQTIYQKISKNMKKHETCRTKLTYSKQVPYTKSFIRYTDAKMFYEKGSTWSCTSH